jgi:hypothetical protein
MAAGVLATAAWSRDSRHVLWHSKVSTAPGIHASLYSVADGRSVDLSHGFQDVFQTSTLDFDPVWTPDGRFVAGSNLTLGGYLIQPVPWEIRLIGRKLRRPGDTVPPCIRVQDAPGVLVACFSPDEAIVDYSGNVLKRLGPGGMSKWTVLPGGKRAVSIRPDGDVAATELDLNVAQTRPSDRAASD